MHPSTESLHKSPKHTVCNGGFYEAAAGRDFPPHSHDGWEFVYYRKGFPTCGHGGESFHARPGLLWITPPGVVHSETAVTAYANTFFLVRTRRPLAWPRTVLDDPRRNLERLCAEIVMECKDRRDETMLRVLLHELCLRIDRCAREHVQTREAQIVGRAEMILAASPPQDFRVSHLARQVGVSASGLRAAFQKVLGESPRARWQELRARQALALLQSSSLTLEAVAGLCGYDSASHLSRWIKRKFGGSPGEIRNASRKKVPGRKN